MRIGELLDAAIKLYRAHWRTFMAIAAAVLVPYTFLQHAMVRVATHPFEVGGQTFITQEDATLSALLAAAFSLGLFLFIRPFLAGALARATSHAYLGNVPEVGATYRFALRRTHSMLWASLLSALATIFGMLLLIVPGVLAFVRFTFAAAVVIVEGERGTKALGRSWRLARGHFWKILGTVFLAGILTAVVSGILQLPLTAAARELGPDWWFLAAIGESLATVIANPFSAIVAVLLYFDMRIRKEGFDLSLMAEELARPA
jgi:hypothetical protein